MKSNTKNAVFEVLILVIVISIFVLSFIFKNQLENLVTKEVIGYGLLMMFVISFFLEILPQYITPHLLLIEAAILGFPLLTSLILVIAGSTAGSIAGFEIGKHYGKKIIKKIYNEKKFASIEKKVIQHEKWILPLAAVSPVPYIPLIFGSIGVTRKNFLIFGVITRILGLAAFSIFFV